MKLELIGEINFYLAVLIKVAASLIVGGIVGYERQANGKILGLKASILICLGSCLYALISFLNIGNGTVLDPNRIAAQVVSGVGFLGAGAIFRDQQGSVHGLTTAAVIWVVAALGVIIGIGYPITAICAAIVGIAVLELVPSRHKGA